VSVQYKHPDLVTVWHIRACERNAAGHVHVCVRMCAPLMHLHAVQVISVYHQLSYACVFHAVLAAIVFPAAISAIHGGHY
jgi:hypothetical protein